METRIVSVELGGEDDNGTPIINFTLNGASVWFYEHDFIELLKNSNGDWNL